MAKQELKRTLEFRDLLMFGIGGVVGAGIYAIIGQASALSGNVLWLSFMIAAVVAILTAMSYAEFVSRFPDAGGSFEYIKQGIGEKTALFMSVFMAFTGIVAAAAIAISFAGYLSLLIAIPQWLGIIAVITLMAIFNIFGSKYSANFNTFSTIITLLGLAIVVLVCIPDWGSHDLLLMRSNGLEGVLAGAALIFFSYVGFEDLVKLAEDAKQPRRDLPRAILISGVLVLFIYILIAISSISVLGSERLGNSDAPLAEVLEAKLGAIGATILAVVALFATSKTVLSNILGTSRLLYDIARDTNISWLKSFTTISGIGNAPNYAIIAISIVSIAFALIGSLKVVASISNIFIFIVFIMVNVALLSFRYKNSPSTDPKTDLFRVPFNVRNIPVPTILALLSLVFLLVFNVYNIIQGG